MLEHELLSLMKDTITIESAGALDQYGARTYGPPQTWLARVQGQVQEIRNVQGAVSVSSAQIHCVPGALANQNVLGAVQIGANWYQQLPIGSGAGQVPAPKPNDRLTLPDGTKPLILRVNTENDETGPHHVVIFS